MPLRRVGRPNSTEADPYYFKYIRLVAGDDPTVALERQLETMASELPRVSEKESLVPYAPDKWTMRDVINHLIDTERIFAFRILWIARGFPDALPSFDQVPLSKAADAVRISWAEHIAEFRAVRLATLFLLAHLPDEAWTRIGIAGGKNVSVRGLAFIIAGHTTHHLDLLKTRYTALTTS